MLIQISCWLALLLAFGLHFLAMVVNSYVDDGSNKKIAIGFVIWLLITAIGLFYAFIAGMNWQ